MTKSFVKKTNNALKLHELFFETKGVLKYVLKSKKLSPDLADRLMTYSRKHITEDSIKRAQLLIEKPELLDGYDNKKSVRRLVKGNVKTYESTLENRKLTRKAIQQFDTKILFNDDRFGLDDTMEEIEKYLKKDLLLVKNTMPRFKFDSTLYITHSKKIREYDIDDVQNKSNYTERIIYDKKYLVVYLARKIITNQDINEVCTGYKYVFENAYEKMNLIGSGWSLVSINLHTTRIYEITQIGGASYIATPQTISSEKNGLVNIKNNDDRCFMWCLLYHQSDKSKNSIRITALQKINDKYDYSDITFPVSMEDIDIFEKNNTDTKITVYECTNKKDRFNVLRQSTSTGRDSIYLLRVTDDKNSHFIYIKNISHLFKSFSKNKTIFCDKCLSTFTPLKMKTHQCSIVENDDFKTVIEYPNETEYMQMTAMKRKNKLIAPFIITADFEAFVIPNNDEKKIHIHKANSYALQLICSFDPQYNKLLQYRGDDCVEHLITTLLKIKKKCDRTLLELRRINKIPFLTKEEEIQFQLAKKCYLCECDFTDSPKVRDHCHYSNKYRGASCNNCNLHFTGVTVNKRGEQKIKLEDLVIIFHNLRSYDGNFIIQHASKFCKNIKVLKQSFEKFMTFSFCGLKFIDSFLFMSSSLDNLTESLKTNNADKYENFIFMKQHFKENAELMIRKGVYCYEYAQNKEVFLLKGLPEKKHFYSQLKNAEITNEEYSYAQLVYNTMGCKNFGDYHDLYLKTDVLLLADIFQNFRCSAISKYKLDPANYLTAPSMAWDAMLEMTKIKLGLIHNDETRILFESNKRGGIVQAGGTRHAFANNKYMKNYDDTKESSFISYLDMNNQYGCAMIDFLPTELNGFCDKTLQEIINHKADDAIGYFVECDIEIPVELHEKFKQLPLCPISRGVKFDELSTYQQSLLKIDNNTTKHNEKTKKLILDFHKKEKYLVHYRYLQFVVKMGYIVTKIHRCVEFKQSQWLKPYIDSNTNYRKEKGISPFLKDFYKLMNNSIYGKTNENILGRNTLDLIKDDKFAIKKMSKENFKTASIQDDLYFIESNKMKVKYDRPSYLGNAILDLSKLYMLEFHYEYMQPKYGNACELIYTDTDSFVYHIKTNDLYQEQFNDREKYFDMSETSIKDFKDDQNAKKIGMMKDESCMIPIIEFLALAPKSYSFICDDNKNNKKCKGVNRQVLKNEITHADYINTIVTGKNVVRKNTSIRSIKHQLYTLQTPKVCLSAFDTKLYRESYNVGVPFGYIK